MTASPADFTGPAKTSSYRVGGPVGLPLFFFDGQLHPWSLAYVVPMSRDPRCRLAMFIRKAPIYRITWEVTSKQEEVRAWIDATLRRFWDNELARALRMLDFGRSGAEQVWQMDDAGLLQFEHLLEVHPLDVWPLHAGRRLAGVRVSGTLGQNGPLDLLPPRSFYLANDPDPGTFLGRSVYQGMFDPWLEKRGKNGYVDTRRLWHLKNAYDGGEFRYPDGDSFDDAGQERHNQDIAREMAEKRKTGGILTMPSERDENGNYLWEWIPPKVNGEIGGVKAYGDTLDQEILEGADIPPEVAKAAETGSGWSGRSVPLIVFLTGCDATAKAILQGVDAQILRPGARANFGSSASYSIKLKSLVEMAQSAPAPGGMPGQPGQPGQPNQVPGQTPIGGDPRRPASLNLSFDESDHPRDDGKFTDKAKRAGLEHLREVRKTMAETLRENRRNKEGLKAALQQAVDHPDLQKHAHAMIDELVGLLKQEHGTPTRMIEGKSGKFIPAVKERAHRDMQERLKADARDLWEAVREYGKDPKDREFVLRHFADQIEHDWLPDSDRETLTNLFHPGDLAKRFYKYLTTSGETEHVAGVKANRLLKSFQDYLHEGFIPLYLNGKEIKGIEDLPRNRMKWLDLLKDEPVQMSIAPVQIDENLILRVRQLAQKRGTRGT